MTRELIIDSIYTDYSYLTVYTTFVIVLEKRSNFAVKLIFQNKLLKSDTQADFVYNPECSN